jgi:hypothetical protein
LQKKEVSENTIQHSPHKDSTMTNIHQEQQTLNQFSPVTKESKQDAPQDQSQDNQEPQQHAHSNSSEGPTDSTKRAQQESDNAQSPPIPLNLELLDEHTAGLVQTLSESELKNLVCTLLDGDTGFFELLKEVVDSGSDLHDAIEAVTAHITDDPEHVEKMADMIEDNLGCRPFSLSFADRETDFVDPFVNLDVDDKTLFVKNPQINAQIVSHATRIRGVTENGQKRLTKQWSEALGAKRLREFKSDRHPHALGFAMPELIPANGDERGETPLTSIPYIGEATAEEIHPDGELMSVGDVVSLTPRQYKLIDWPITEGARNQDRATRILEGMVKKSGGPIPKTIGYALGLKDKRDDKGACLWVDQDAIFGVFESVPEDIDLGKYSPLSSAEIRKSGGKEHLLATSEDGSQACYSPVYWDHISTIADTFPGCKVTLAADSPAIVELPNGNIIALANRAGSPEDILK